MNRLFSSVFIILIACCVSMDYSRRCWHRMDSLSVILSTFEKSAEEQYSKAVETLFDHMSHKVPKHDQKNAALVYLKMQARFISGNRKETELIKEAYSIVSLFGRLAFVKSRDDVYYTLVEKTHKWENEFMAHVNKTIDSFLTIKAIMAEEQKQANETNYYGLALDLFLNNYRLLNQLFNESFLIGFERELNKSPSFIWDIY